MTGNIIQTYKKYKNRRVNSILATHDNLPPLIKKPSSFITNRDYIDKDHVKSVLKACYDISIHGINDPRQRASQFRKSIEDLEAQFRVEPKMLTQVIRQKAKDTYEDTLQKIRDKGMDFIDTEIEAEKQKIANPKKIGKYCLFMESLDYNLRNSKTNPDDVKNILKPAESDHTIPKKFSEILNESNSKIDLNKKKFRNGVNNYITEINTLKVGINDMLNNDNKNVEICNKFYKALNKGDEELVCKMANDHPELVNHIFSVFYNNFR